MITITIMIMIMIMIMTSHPQRRLTDYRYDAPVLIPSHQLRLTRTRVRKFELFGFEALVRLWYYERHEI